MILEKNGINKAKANKLKNKKIKDKNKYNIIFCLVFRDNKFTSFVLRREFTIIVKFLFYIHSIKKSNLCIQNFCAKDHLL